MKILFALTLDFLAMLFFVVMLTSLITNPKEVLKGHPRLLRNPLFLIITGSCMAMVIIFFALAVLMWQMPVNHYEQVTEPLYRLKP